MIFAFRFRRGEEFSASVDGRVFRRFSESTTFPPFLLATPIPFFNTVLFCTPTAKRNISAGHRVLRPTNLPRSNNSAPSVQLSIRGSCFLSPFSCPSVLLVASRSRVARPGVLILHPTGQTRLRTSNKPIVQPSSLIPDTSFLAVLRSIVDICLNETKSLPRIGK